MQVEKVQESVERLVWEDLEEGDVFTWGACEVAFIKIHSNLMFNTRTNSSYTPHESFSGDLKRLKAKIVVEGLSGLSD